MIKYDNKLITIVVETLKTIKISSAMGSARFAHLDARWRYYFCYKYKINDK